MTRLLPLVLAACTVAVGDERDHPIVPNVGPAVVGGSHGSSAGDAGVPPGDAVFVDAGTPRPDGLTIFDAQKGPDAMRRPDASPR